MTQPVDSALRRLPPDAGPASTPRLPSAPPAPRELDVDALPLPARGLGTFLQNAKVTQTTALQPAIPSRDAVSQAKLDAYRATFSGPYVVDGKSVQAPAQFRMGIGYNDAVAGYTTDAQGRGAIDAKNSPARDVFAACKRAGAPDPTFCLMGCASAQTLVAVTQALINAGWLPSGSGDLPSRIKTMQWNAGIGVDCTDYVVGAALKVAGRAPAQLGVQPGVDYFKDAENNHRLTAVGLGDARPGDVFCLKSPNAREAGHRAIVYSRTACDTAAAVALGAKYGTAATQFLKGGPVQMFEVDSSFGAGALGSSLGGVRRDTWLFNESSGRWAQIAPSLVTSKPAEFVTTPRGPKDETLTGIYRFR